MGGKSKKLIYVGTPHGVFGALNFLGRWAPLERKLRLSNPRQILAHNDDKRKKIMFVTGLGGFE